MAIYRLARPEREQRLRSTGRSTSIRTGPISSRPSATEFDDPAPKAMTNPNEKQPKTDEFSLSLERELVANFAVRVTGLYARTNNINRIQNNLRPYEAYNIPVTNQDPGPDGERRDRGRRGHDHVLRVSPELAGRPIRRVHAHQRPESRSATYKSIELAAVKRLANRWQFMASYSATKKRPPHPSRLGGRRARTAATPATRSGTTIPTTRSTGPTRPGTGMASSRASYIFPGDVMLSRELPPSQRRRVRAAGADSRAA